MQARIFIGIAAAAIIALSVFVVNTFMEKYETEIWTGASKEARVNPYLAATQFLQKRDVNVFSTSDSLDFEAIDINDIVFLTRVDSMLVSESQINNALDWVNRGGYLLVGVRAETEGNTSILNRFDIDTHLQQADIEEQSVDQEAEPLTTSERMREVNRKIEEARAEKERAAKEKANVEQENGQAAESSDAKQAGEPDEEKNKDRDFTSQLLDLLNIEYEYEYYKVSLDQDKQELHLAVLDEISLEHPIITGEPIDDEEFGDDEYLEEDVANAVGSDRYNLTSWVSDEQGPRLLQFEYGDGTFTVLSSAELWKNDYIGLADHAYFLSYLVPDESQLHLFYNVTTPSIWSLIKRYFYEFLWISLALLILWLWRRGMRVQPVVSVVEGQRRSFAEHLGASAKFMVANNQFDNLLEPLKDDIELQLRPFYPNFSDLNETAQIAVLAEATQIPNHTLSQWLAYCRKVNNQDELLAALKIGNAIRKKL